MKDKKYTGNVLAWNEDYAIVVYEQKNQYALTFLSYISNYWHIPVVCDAIEYSCIYEFKHKPTQDDLMKFIKNIVRIHYYFLEGCKVNTNAWIDLTGEPPTEFLNDIKTTTENKQKKTFEDQHFSLLKIFKRFFQY